MRYFLHIWLLFFICFCSFAHELKDGLAPAIKLPELKRHIIARSSLEKLAPGEKLSQKNAETILQSVLYYSRVGLYQSNISSSTDMEKFYSADEIGGYCILAQKLNIIYLLEIGLTKEGLYPLEMSKAFGCCEYHATLIVKMPDGNYYLLDPTFRQFFSAELKAGKVLNRIGYALCETRAGRELAVRLMVNGYARLTDETANLYLKAFQVDNPESKTCNIEHLLEKAERDVKSGKALFGDSIPQMPALKELKFKYFQSK